MDRTQSSRQIVALTVFIIFSARNSVKPGANAIENEEK